MSDAARKDFSDKAQEKLTPESQKGPLDKATETATDAYDSVAKSVQPGDSKSTSQKLFDTGDNASSDAQSSGKGYLEQAQEMGSNAFNSASEAAGNLLNSVTGNKK